MSDPNVTVIASMSFTEVLSTRRLALNLLPNAKCTATLMMGKRTKRAFDRPQYLIRTPPARLCSGRGRSGADQVRSLERHLQAAPAAGLLDRTNRGSDPATHGPCSPRPR